MTAAESATPAQVGQVVSTDNLTEATSAVPISSTQVCVLGSQKITLPESAESPAKGAQLARTPEVAEQLAVRRSAPLVVAGEIVTHPPYRSPLDADEHGRYPTSLRGGVVDDPDEIKRIAVRVEHGARPAWWRR